MKEEEMSNKLTTLVLLLLLTLLISSGASAEYSRNSVNPAPALAPIGTSFTYQGSLIDGGGPANGAYDFEFKLFNDASVGTQVGSTVTKGDVDTTEGIFTVELGFGDVFDGTAFWLEIWVRPGASTDGYQQLLPRQPLTAVPYANYALDADLLDGLQGSSYRDASNIDAGRLNNARFSAYSDISAEGHLGTHLYQVLSSCGGGLDDDLTLDSNCQTLTCQISPRLWFTCEGSCSAPFQPTCPNIDLGQLVD
jgi:hypothetical protein